MISLPVDRQSGLSVVELMVALLLASILTTGLVQIFTSNSQTFRLNEASARVQESGRMASDILNRAIRNADYWGCSKPSDGRVRSMLNDSNDFVFADFVTGLYGESLAEPGNGFGAVPGTDVITFGGLDSNAALSTTAQTPNNSATIFTGQDPSGLIEEDEIVLISDCRAADMFQVTQLRTGGNRPGLVANTGQNTPGNNSQTQSDYDSGATITRPIRQSFYVAETPEDGRFLAYNPVQTRQTNDSVVGQLAGTIQLVSNIHDFQIQFGDPSGSGNAVSEWRRPGQAVGDNDPSSAGSETANDAVAVRYSFLVRSPQADVVDERQFYCFPGWLDCEGDPDLRTSADDRNLYRVYTMTATIRNRLRD